MIKNILHSLRSFKPGSFKYNFLVTSSSGAIGFLLQLIFTPIIARIYSPEDFGEFALYNLIITNLIILVGLSYNEAIVALKKTKEFSKVLQLYLVSAVLSLLVIFTILILTGQTLFESLFTQEVNWLWILFPALIINFLCTAFQTINIRFKEFLRNAKASLAVSASSRIFTLTLGLIQPSAFGLIVGILAAQFVSIFILPTKKMLLKVWALKPFSIDRTKFTAAFKKYSSYPFYLMPSHLIVQISNQIPVFFLSTYFAATYVGIFYFANSLLSIPMNIIGNAMRPVYFQRAAELKDDIQELGKLTQSLLNKFLLLGTPVLLVLFLFGSDLFLLVLGESWEKSGDVASVLGISYFYQLISSPFSNIRKVFRVEHQELSVQILFLVLRGSIFIFYYFDQSFDNTILVYSIINTVIYLINLYSVLHIIKLLNLKMILKTLSPVLIILALALIQ